MSDVFQAIPFKLGDLRLVLVPKFTREDLEWLRSLSPDAQRTDKETGRLAYRILDLTFRCAFDNSAGLKMEDIFAEFSSDPKRHAPALAIALMQLACSILEEGKNSWPLTTN